MSDEYTIPKELLARCVGKTELVQRVLAAFVKQLDNDIPKLTADLRAGDFEGAAKTAHRVKGAAANVAADGLRASAERIEDLARNPQIDDVPAHVNQLQEDWNKFVELTAKFLG